MDEIFVNCEESYSIFIGEQLLTSQELLSLYQDDFHKLVIITDDHVGPLYANQLKQFLLSHQLDTHVITIPHGEKSKSRAMKAQIEDQLFELRCGRDTCLIALGGGVITDLTGFVAATYLRGIDVIYCPTSLLAMVDASIGGKTGINTAYGKNLIGAFSQPKAIIADTAVLATLPEKEYRDAFAEMIKHAVVFDGDYFNFLKKHAKQLLERDHERLHYAIKRSCSIKSKVVAADEKEENFRELLNYGHTIGHAIEQAANYQLSHGEAVAIGIVVEAYIANQRNHLDDSDFIRIKTILKHYHFPLQIPNITKENFLKALSMDKKSRQNNLRFTLLLAIGMPDVISPQIHTTTIRPELLNQALDYLLENFSGETC